MPASWTQITTRHPYPAPAALKREIGDMLAAYGDIGVKHIKAVEWAIRRFKKPTGRSTNAWKSIVNRDRLYLTIYNDAANRYGTMYAPYVHLAGRPRSDRLWQEVEAYTGGALAGSISRAVGYAYIKAQKAVPAKTTTKTFG